MSVVGFDIGNQSTYIAVARQGGIETITNDYSQRATPSCVAFGSKTRVMGVAALQQAGTNLKNTVLSFKQLVGRRFDDPIVQEELKWLAYELVELSEHRIGIKVTHLGETRVFTPEQILAILLTKLKDVTESYLKTKVTDCVLSVPSFWTDSQRRSLLDASKIVDLNCLRVVNETTAVALNYGIYKQDLPDEAEKPRKVLFIDMGHSSTQVYICAFNKGKLKMIGTAWDLTLGGRDFDAVLREFFTGEFKQKYKIDAKTNMRAWCRLLDECEKVKKQMSANSNNIPLNIECFMNDKDVTGMIKRSDFEAMTAPLWTKLQNLIVRILNENKHKPTDIDVIELVGGGSRMPMVRQIVNQIFEKDPFTTLNQDEAVARGCALQCAILSPTFRVREFNITDVQPFAIKLTWKAESGYDEGEAEVFNEHHAFPFSKILTFYRKEPFVLEASYAYPNHIPFLTTKIGQFLVNNVTPGSDGDSSKVKVKVRINGNGLFTVSSASLYEKQQQTEDEQPEANVEAQNAADAEKEQAQNGPTNEMESMQTDKPAADATNQAGEPTEAQKPTKQKVKVKSIDLPITEIVPHFTDEDVKRFRSMELELQKQDRQEREKADAKNALEEYVYEMRDKLSEKLSAFISEQDANKFSSMLEDIGNWLYEDGDDQPKHVYVDRLNDLKKIGDPVVERFSEAQERPHAFEELGHSLQMSRKFYELYLAKDTKYDHIDSTDMERVRKIIEEKQAWFEQQVNSQQRRPLTEPPVVFATQIRLEKEALERVVVPVMNKPKPKVELPPEPVVNKNGTAGTNETASGEKAEMEVD